MYCKENSPNSFFDRTREQFHMTLYYLHLTDRCFTRSERAGYLGVERVTDATEASGTSGDPCHHAGAIGAGQGIVLERVATPGEGRKGASPSAVTERHLVGAQSDGRDRRPRVSPGMSSFA